MRRLAAQSRDDTYNSKRDYQQTHLRQSARLTNTADSALTVLFAIPPEIEGQSLAWGGYFAANRSLQLAWRLRTTTEVVAEGKIALDARWSKGGGHAHRKDTSPMFLEFEIPKDSAIDLWGIDAGPPAAKIGEYQIDLNTVLAGNLTPESFYLPHESALNLDFVDDGAPSSIERGRDIFLKKCSYCGRLLPIDPDRLGAISFHKHNAKRTKHQNECLSCKKWKINDDLNPTRSTDQLHESSVITRERKLFLREPARLKEFKERTDTTGLRTYIWKKFDKQCFLCKQPVGLDEFQLDHTRPMAYLWPIDQYATCLCATHNNEKKDKFPIDFYTAEQLEELSRITGLSLDILRQKEINLIELVRILDDLEGFARAWEPRTFFATARKIRELAPERDIEEMLQRSHPELYSRLLFEYNPREDPEADPEDNANSDGMHTP